MTLFEAILEGARRSKFAIDPDHPDRRGDLTRFFASLADQFPVAYMGLLEAVFDHEAETEATRLSRDTDDLKPGRLQ